MSRFVKHVRAIPASRWSIGILVLLVVALLARNFDQGRDHSKAIRTAQKAIEAAQKSTDLVKADLDGARATTEIEHAAAEADRKAQSEAIQSLMAQLLARGIAPTTADPAATPRQAGTSRTTSPPAASPPTTQRPAPSSPPPASPSPTNPPPSSPPSTSPPTTSPPPTSPPAPTCRVVNPLTGTCLVPALVIPSRVI